MGEIRRILPLTCGETATFKAKFCERPLLSVMNVGAAAFAVFHLGLEAPGLGQEQSVYIRISEQTYACFQLHWKRALATRP